MSVGSNRNTLHRLASAALYSRGVAALLLAIILTPAFAAPPALNTKAPVFVRTGLDSKRIDLRAYRGKAVLLDFWATWCAPCEIEMPTFVAWQNKYGPRGLQVIGISMDDDPALVRTAYSKLKINYPIAMGDAKLGELYGGVMGLPLTYLIDTHGVIRARYQGETDLGKMEIQLQKLLPRP